MSHQKSSSSCRVGEQGTRRGPNVPNHPKQNRSVCLRPSTAPFNHKADGDMEEHQYLDQAKNITTQSSATNWFDQANAHIAPGPVNTLENDPPFYITRRGWNDNRRSSSVSGGGRFPNRGQVPTLFHRNDSENEDLRQIIDDLTIENKMLKQRLQRREQSYHPSLHQDKLFELRLHGLFGPKKRELQGMLRDFMSNLNDSDDIGGLHPSHQPGPRPQNIKDGQKSMPWPADSAYASISNSGPTSIAASGQGNTLGPLPTATKDKQVQSYLHDIPEDILPKLGPDMTEEIKKRLVVKRLEQLFTGAAPGEHSFPEKQQKVSQSAAKAEAQLASTTKHPRFAEGAREAQIMPHGSLNADEAGQDHLEAYGEDPGTSPAKTKRSPSEGDSPGQRPTRPLDLDLHRAQIPLENLEYIQHLGVASPNLTPHQSSRSPDGWVYLNVVMNMAQLHTVNVTPDFIRKAVAERSSKFELSADGRRIRWKGKPVKQQMDIGSPGITDLLSAESPTEHEFTAKVGTGCQSRDVAGRNSSRDVSGLKSVIESGSCGFERTVPGVVSNDSVAQPFSSLTIGTGKHFEYKPLFFKERRSEYDDDYMTSEPSQSSSPGRISATVIASNSLPLTRLSTQTKAFDDGMIIYYNNSNFCADFSTDSPENLFYLPPRKVSESFSRALGDRTSASSGEDENDELKPRHGPLILPVPHEKTLEDTLQIYGDSDLPSQNQSPQMPIAWEASGLGGILPADNFAINVRLKRTSTRNASLPNRPAKQLKLYNYEVSQSERLDLAPSALPPPSFMFGPTSSSSASSSPSPDDSDDSDGDQSESERDVTFVIENQSLLSSSVPSSASSDGDSDDNFLGSRTGSELGSFTQSLS